MGQGKADRRDITTQPLCGSSTSRLDHVGFIFVCDIARAIVNRVANYSIARHSAAFYKEHNPLSLAGFLALLGPKPKAFSQIIPSRELRPLYLSALINTLLLRLVTVLDPEEQSGSIS